MRSSLCVGWISAPIELPQPGHICLTFKFLFRLGVFCSGSLAAVSNGRPRRDFLVFLPNNQDIGVTLSHAWK